MPLRDWMACVVLVYCRHIHYVRLLIRINPPLPNKFINYRVMPHPFGNGITTNTASVHHPALKKFGGTSVKILKIIIRKKTTWVAFCLCVSGAINVPMRVNACLRDKCEERSPRFLALLRSLVSPRDRPKFPYRSPRSAKCSRETLGSKGGARY